MNRFRNLIGTENDQDPRFIALVRTVLGISAIASFGIVLGLFLFPGTETQWGTISIVSVIGALTLLFFGLTFRNILLPGKFFLPIAMLIAVPYIATQANGLHDSAIALFPVIIIIASLLIGQKVLPLFTALTILGVWSVAYYDMAGLNDSIIASRTGIDDVVVITLGQVMAAGALNGLMIRMNRALEQSLANEQAQAKANIELRELQTSLEERIEQRTLELEKSAVQLQKRAEQFEAIAQIARTIGAIQNLEELLPRITRMVSQRFGFYHVGIFLLDEDREFAVLRAANSPGGQQMLARGHRLQVGHTGIVGYTTSTGNPRIALDTGADAVYFNNPDLPETHSEMALPLLAGKRIIGALDVQSTEPNAFTQEDVNIMLTLAGQVSSAIQNASLYEESRTALKNAEEAFHQLTGQTWSNIKQITPLVGYKFDGTKPEPLTQPSNHRASEIQSDTLSIPVKLRSTTIGNLRVKAPSTEYQWTEDEITIIQATAERIALAVENARLLLESQKQAAKEQVIGEISTKIGASINLDNILQTTLREMGRILPGAEISIQVEKE